MKMHKGYALFLKLLRTAIDLLTKKAKYSFLCRVFVLDGLLVPGHYFGLFSSVLYLELHIQLM
ncbi:hypothetical protein CsSME_00015165 [Camellia sinensis var. sinensis]